MKTSHFSPDSPAGQVLLRLLDSVFMDAKLEQMDNTALAKIWAQFLYELPITSQLSLFVEETIVRLDPAVLHRVKDDNGVMWGFSDGRIQAFDDPTPDGGYLCKNFEEGVELLKKYGYLHD